MRFFEILLEYKRDVTKQQLGDRLVSASQRDRQQDIDTILAELEAMDPTTNKQYVLWLANQYIKGLFRLEDTPRVKDVLEKFINAKSRLPEKDLGRYTFHSLEDQMDKIYNVELKPQQSSQTDQSAGQSQAFEVPENVDVLYNGPLGLLAVPKTKKASCELGSGTKWCTASREGNMFADYNKEAPLYIWRDKNGDKYQFHFGYDPQFMNDKDRPISKKLLQYFSQTHPVLKKLFKLGNKHYVRQLAGWQRKIPGTRYSGVESVIYRLKKYLGQQGTTLEAVAPLLKDDPVFLAAILALELKRYPEIEEVLDLTNASTALFDQIAKAKLSSSLVNYIGKYINQRIPALEEALLKNLNNNDVIVAAIDYANDIIKGNWLELEKRLPPKHYFQLHSYIDSAKKRFIPKLEKVISANGHLAIEYAQKVVKTKWPEGEKAILRLGGTLLDDYNKFLRRKGFTSIYRPKKKAKKTAKKKASKK